MGVAVFPAAASGPTLAEITAAGNSAGWNDTGSPFTATWTNLGTITGNNATTYTINSLGGYRYLRFDFNFVFTGGYIATFRFNSDSGSNYVYVAQQQQNSSSTPFLNYGSKETYFSPQQAGAQTQSSNAVSNGHLIIDNATSGAYKKFTGRLYGNSSQRMYDFDGVWLSTNAITSLTISSTQLVGGFSGNVYITGGN